MFVNWAHHLTPKFSFVFSYIANPLFIYLIHNNNQVLLGPYRYLLFFFAIFNMLASLVDILVPVCVHDYQYACITFLVDGPFSQRSDLGELALAVRCAFIAGTYGILDVHFMFRYLVLRRNDLITRFFMPYGLLASVVYVTVHMVIWAMIDLNCIYSAPEMRDYVRESFNETFHEDIENINFLAGLFSQASPDIIRRSWAGLVLLTAVASYSIVLYVIIGNKIITRLNEMLKTTSHKTSQMQKQLFKALTIQTVIPIFVSFLPCSFALYGAAFRMDFYNWVYWGSSVAVSMFPFLDPLAIIFFLPALRQKLCSRWIKPAVAPQNSVITVNQRSESRL